MVFRPNSQDFKSEETADEVNDGDLHVYINRDIFLSWFLSFNSVRLSISEQKKKKQKKTDYFLTIVMVCE